MATLAAARLKDSATLDTSERNAVRRTMGASLKSDADDYADIEAAFPSGDSDVNRWLRAYLDDWDAISRAPTRLSGGSDAIEYNTVAHKYEVYTDICGALGITPMTYAAYVQFFTESAGFGVVTIQVGDPAGTVAGEFG